MRSGARGTMVDGADDKKRLARVQLERRRGDQDAQAPKARIQPAARRVPLGLDAALGECDGTPTVDLARMAISLSALAFVPREQAQDRLVLPLYADEQRLLLAVSDAEDRFAAEELARVSGRSGQAYVAVNGPLRDVIEAAYAAAARGAASYRGARASEPQSRAYDSFAPPSYAPAASEASALWVALSDPSLTAIEPQLAPSKTTVASLRPPKSRVLVVEPDARLRDRLVVLLTQQGYVVLESESGQGALDSVRESAPDFIVLDTALPDLHGFELCRRIKASRRFGHIVLIVLSEQHRGWRIAEDLRAAYGVHELLEKPADPDALLAALARDVDQPAGGPEPVGAGPGEAHLHAGLAAYSRGDVATAIDHLRQGITADPHAFRLHYHLGLLYGKQDNVFEAIQTLEAAARLSPRDFSTLKNLALLYERGGFRLKATEMWQRALGNAPDETTRGSIREHLLSLL